MGKNIFDFCREYNYIPGLYNEYSFTTVDLPGGYSVLTKTLEDIFQTFYKKSSSNKFKNKFNEESYGVLIYLSFLEMFYLFIDTNKDKFHENHEKDIENIDSDFIKLFFKHESNHPNIFIYNLNLAYNVNKYQNQRNIQIFENDFNESIFFMLLSKNTKMVRNGSGNVPFESAMKFVLRYIISGEVYMMVKTEINKCHQMYNDKFTLSVKENQYSRCIDSSTIFSEFIKNIDKNFLESCENKIYNIEATVNHNVIRNLKRYYHLDYKSIREYMMLLDENAEMDCHRLKYKKFKVYLDCVKVDYDYFHLFNVIDDWVVNLFYEIFMKYSLDNLTLFSIQSTIQNYFNNVTYQSILFDAFQNIVFSSFKKIKTKDGDGKDCLPVCFQNFSVKGNDPLNHAIARTLKDDFPLNIYNFKEMNMFLWDIICVIKLYRETRTRTNRDFYSFCNRIQFYTKHKVSNFEEDVPIPFILFAMKVFFMKKKVPLMEGFTKCFCKYFKKHFKTNLCEKLRIPSVRLQWIKNNFSMDMFDIEKNLIYVFCCHLDMDYYKSILEKEKECIQKYLVEKYEILSEKINITVYLFCDFMKNKEGVLSDYFKFVVFILLGVSLEISNAPYEKLIQKTLSSLKKKKIFRYPSEFISMRIDDCLFNDYPNICKNILSKYELFVEYLLKVQEIFDDNQNSFDIMVRDRIQIILHENLYSNLMDAYENISS